VEAERRAVRVLGEGVLELVPVVEDGLGGHDRLERRLRDPAQADERIPDLPRLRLDLSLVGEVLEAAPAAGGIVGARRLDALGPGPEELDRERLGMVALHLGDARANGVARQAAADEDDEAVEPGDAVAPVRQRVDRQLELLAHLHRSRHARSLAWQRAKSRA
jgi:hypothetical protein